MEADLFGPDWRVISKLGEGSFSEVYKVKSCKNQNFYAIKKLKKRYRSVEEVNRLPEITALRALQGNPNIIKLEEVLYDSQHNCLALVLELMDMNLYEFIQKRQLDEKCCLLLIYQLLKALCIMHKKNLFHRDIKPENCMVNADTLELKLADFGSTRMTSDSGPFTEYIATRWYRAPECILTSGSYGPAVDIWAVGCILFEILTKVPLFPGNNQLDQIAKIHNILGTPGRDVLNHFKQNPNSNINYAFPYRVPQEIKNLLPESSPEVIDIFSKMLVYDPANRISAEEALKHPAFELYRKMEAMYRTTQMDVPFSYFFLTNSQQTPLFARDNVSNAMFPIHAPITPPISLIQQVVMQQAEEQPPKAVINNQKHVNIQNQNMNTTQIQSKTQKVVAPIVPTNLAESRRITIERLRLYNEHQNKLKKQQQTKYQPTAPLHFGPAKVIKPGPLPHITINPYQKPSVDLIKPRITGIQFPMRK